MLRRLLRAVYALVHTQKLMRAVTVRQSEGIEAGCRKEAGRLSCWTGKTIQLHGTSSVLCIEENQYNHKKKEYTYSERSTVDVFWYVMIMMMLIVTLHVSNFVFVDESGLNRYYHRELARAARGTRVRGKKPGKRFKRTNVIAGLSGSKHLAVRCYEHTTTAKFFEEWFEWELLSEIQEGSVIIMDNAAFHRKSKLYDIASRYNVVVLFLPPYSPDLNPIEKSWANLKHWLKSNLSRFPSLDFAVECYFSECRS